MPRIKRKNESGQALIFVTLGLVVLTGFAGLGVDMGMLRYEKRLQQSAADAAAISGASNLANPLSGGLITGGQAAAATNGFTDNGGGQASNCTAPGAAVGTVCVEINNPPTSGPHAADPQYVEAIVAAVHPTYFMKILTINSEAISARAVATNLVPGSNGGCMYTLAPPNGSGNNEGVFIAGAAPKRSPTINAPNCGILDNGDYDNDTTPRIIADTFGVAGNAYGARNGTLTCAQTPASCPTMNMPAAADPLITVVNPPASPGPGAPPTNIGGVLNILPGVFNSLNIGNVTAVFNPGVYILNGAGGLVIHAGATVTGNGVTFYFTNNATVTVQGAPSIQLSAPAAGPNAGVLFYQDPADNSNASIGGDTGDYQGAFYFPNSQVTINPRSNVNIALLVAKSLSMDDSSTLNLTGSSGLPPGVQVIRVPTLVE